MAYTIDRWGNEVDELGFTRQGVEEWAERGIYPPPLCGSPTPESVARVKDSRARQAALTREQRAQRLQEAHRRADAIDRRLGIDTRPTRASSSS